MITINSWDELFETGVKIVTEQIQPDDIELNKDLVFQVRVFGPSWDETIDYRGAQYILDLQKSINKMYSEVIGDIPLPALNKLVTVKVKVVKGSSIFEIKLDEVLKKVMDKMSGTQATLIAICGIFCITGYLTTGKILDYKKQVLDREQVSLMSVHHDNITETIVSKLSETLNTAVEIIDKNDLEAPNRKLIRRLDKDDTIKFHGQPEIGSETAKKMYPRKEKVTLQSGRYDGIYTITSINFEKRPIQFSLKKDDFEFRAEAELANQDIEQISKNLEESLKAKKDFEVSLHLHILYDDKGVKSASIQGTGEPRENSGDVINLISNWRSSTIKI